MVVLAEVRPAVIRGASKPLGRGNRRCKKDAEIRLYGTEVYSVNTMASMATQGRRGNVSVFGLKLPNPSSDILVRRPVCPRR
jgi:hypothetical protein